MCVHLFAKLNRCVLETRGDGLPYDRFDQAAVVA
jgi:hypothetical protein